MNLLFRDIPIRLTDATVAEYSQAITWTERSCCSESRHSFLFRESCPEETPSLQSLTLVTALCEG
jgi:hypothetical protein